MPNVTRHTPHATRHTPHATRHTPHATRPHGHTPHATRHTPHATRHTPHATRHTPHATRHTPHATRHTATRPHATRHTPHATRHTPHATRHTPHATRHTLHATRHTPHATRLTKAKGLQRTLKVAREILVRPLSVVDAEIKAPRILRKTSTEMKRMRMCEWANYIIELLFKKQKMQQTEAGVERRPLKENTMSQGKTIRSEWRSSKMCCACNTGD
jgi:hypothetical protein